MSIDGAGVARRRAVEDLAAPVSRCGRANAIVSETGRQRTEPTAIARAYRNTAQRSIPLQGSLHLPIIVLARSERPERRGRIRQTAATRRQLLPDPSSPLRSLGASKDNDRQMQAAQQRDRSLQRISVLTRAIAVGSVALSAGFATLMALAQPAREDRRCEILHRSSTRDLCTIDRHTRDIARLGTGGNGRAAVDFRPVLGQLPRPSAAGAGLRFRGRECGRVRPVVIPSVAQASFAALGDDRDRARR